MYGEHDREQVIRDLASGRAEVINRHSTGCTELEWLGPENASWLGDDFAGAWSLDTGFVVEDPYGLYAQIERERVARETLAAAAKKLGVSPGIRVALHPPGLCPPSGIASDLAHARELVRPYVMIVRRDEAPPYLVCGDTRAEVLSRVPDVRGGPNGPIDGREWLREGD
jgi:hypothetical protein